MSALTPEIWARLLHRRPSDAGLSPLYGPIIAPPTAPDGCFVLGRLAQSLDGRIAAACGASRWISGHADIVHMHRLRALCDAVIVGAGTVQSDDPQLTTREAEGPSPVRVVLDTNRRLAGHYQVFNGGPPTLLVCAADQGGADQGAEATFGSATVLRVPRAGEGLAIDRLIATLAARGLTRIVVEGGGITVSRFLAAGALDRLHVTIAPLLLGSGIPAFSLPQAASPADGLRCAWEMYRLDEDVLMDIKLVRARPRLCQ